MPQHLAVPPETSTHTCDEPTAIAVAPVMPLTDTGVSALVPFADPFPNCPNVFEPQHLTVPSTRTAHVARSPPLIAITVPSPVGDTGVPELSVDPFPSWPTALRPQHFAV